MSKRLNFRFRKNPKEPAKLLQLTHLAYGSCTGALSYYDELDAKLHPKLLRYVIFLFKDKKINQHGAQLLFTSHDMYTFKKYRFSQR